MQPVDWQTKMRAAIVNAITEDDVREIIQGIVTRAKTGDRQAIAMVLAYVGPPVPPAPLPPTRHERLTAHVNANGNGRRSLPAPE